METQTIITAFLALVACYRLVKLLVYIITGFVVIIALFAVGWGVHKRRKTRRYNHEQTN